ncbi:translation machinery-associated protein 16 [Coemansia sp. RSA 486]|nr:translation machinery-associated protein 16 [Coemansia sp. RSA 486]KAJ2225485.1 translation machinery-associated protein 16 [Coemansia sp. RSA 485]
MNKEALIAKTKGDRINAAMGKGQKLVWFRDNMDTDEIQYDKQVENEVKKIWTKNELVLLLDLYLDRHKEQLEELQAKKDLGRLLSPKEALFLENVKTERKEAEMAGLEVPDLTSTAMVKYLRTWDGDLNSVTDIKLVKVKPTSVLQNETKPKENDQNNDISKITGMTVE